MGRRQQTAFGSLEDHPNAPEIAAVLARVPHLRDHDLIRLAAGWRNSAHLVAARDRALSPTSPLILDVLLSFDRIATIFADDIAGEEAWISVPSDTTVIALKAVRDAIAAAYAKPILSRAEYHALLAPWRKVFPHDQTIPGQRGASRLEQPDLRALIGTLADLAARCHDATSWSLFGQLAEAARQRDIAAVGAAREAAWLSAIGTGRRRPWTLLRSTVAEAIARGCPSCRVSEGARDDVEQEVELALVGELCADAACALLVADSVPTSVAEVLTGPVRRLIPLPRHAEG